MIELLSYEFIQNALIATILTSIICGIVGPFIVMKRLVFMSEGMSHISFGGIGITYYLGLKYLFFGALIFSSLSSIVLANIQKNDNKRKDSFIGIFCSLGITVGVLAIHQKSGYTPDLMHYLFGNILSISYQDLIITTFITIIAIVIVTMFFREFIIISCDQELIIMKGLSLRFLQSILYLIIALTVTALINLIGIMLSTTFLTIPINIALMYVNSIKKIMLVSTILNIIIIFIGLILSYYIDIPSGPAIFIISLAVFLIMRIWKKNKPITKTSLYN